MGKRSNVASTASRIVQRLKTKMTLWTLLSERRKCKRSCSPTHSTRSTLYPSSVSYSCLSWQAILEKSLKTFSCGCFNFSLKTRAKPHWKYGYVENRCHRRIPLDGRKKCWVRNWTGWLYPPYLLTDDVIAKTYASLTRYNIPSTVSWKRSSKALVD